MSEAVDDIMRIRKQKQIVTNESADDKVEQRHSLDTVFTPSCTPPAPLSTSTPACVCYDSSLCHSLSIVQEFLSLFYECRSAAKLLTTLRPSQPT